MNISIQKVLFLAICGVLLIASGAHAAVITGPSSSTTGSFTLSWPAGYELRLNVNDATWRYAAPPTTSYAFSNLPSGAYNFQLAQCLNIPPPFGTGWSCVYDTASALTVWVDRDLEPAIDTGTTQAGTIAYSAGTSKRGSSEVSVPLHTPVGVNGLAPRLALTYDSARGTDISEVNFLDDDLGYGWRLQGLSRVHRCRLGLTGTGAPTLSSTDTYCLDRQLLKLFSGVYGADGSVYRTEIQSHVQVTKMAGDWFEVRYPDGRVANYGDTASSKVKGSGQLNGFFVWSQPSPTVVWAERQVINPLGDAYTVDYDVDDVYGLIRPKLITYSQATVEFKYGPRNDTTLAAFNYGGGYSAVKRTSVLHTVRVKMNGLNVREYRLDSNLISGRMRLEQIQECGYNLSGSTAACLKPLVIGWSAVSGGSSNFPIAIASLQDGMGARTEYYYSTITTTTNPIDYTEIPFGGLFGVPTTLASQSVAAVNEMRKSDGITAGATNRWTYANKSFAYQDSLNRGYVGFNETRVKDEQSGIVAYTQHRLDGFFKGAPSHIRVFTGLFGSGTELERREIAYDLKSVTAGLSSVLLPLPIRVTSWQFEGPTVVGGSEQEVTFCFYNLDANGNCPTSGTVNEHPTQIFSSTSTGNTISNPAVVPGYWGDVPNRVITDVKQTSFNAIDLQNSSSPWLKQLPVKHTNTETTFGSGQSPKTVVNTRSYFTNTAILAGEIKQANDATTLLQWARSFTGNNPTLECLYGSTFGCISTNYGASYVDDRYPPSVTNALTQTTNLAWDSRFGAIKQVNDPDNNITQIEYDPFGRVARRIAMDGTTTTITYARCDSGCGGVVGAQAAIKISTSVDNFGTKVAPDSARYVDVLGRTVLEEVVALDTLDGLRSVRTVYDTRGRVKFVSRPYFTNQTMPDCTGPSLDCTWFFYDIRSRVTQEVRPDGGYTTNSFSSSVGALSVVSVETIKRPGNVDATIAKQNTFNVLGQLIYTIDALGSSKAVVSFYYYDSHGNLWIVYVDGKIVATMYYDLAGNRTQLIESNSGTSNYQFDGRRLMTQATDGQGQPTRYTYDALGRLITRQDRYGLSGQVNNTWDWDTYGATGQLESVTNGLFTETYTYGASAKLTGVATSVAVLLVLTASYNRTFGYDSAGRLSTIAYPNMTVQQEYATNGYLTRYRHVQSGNVLDEVTDTDAFGNVTEQRYQNTAMRTSRTYEQTSGRLQTIQSGTSATPKSIQDLEMAWQSNSSVLLRQDKRNTASASDDTRDVYDYDELNRLYRQKTDLSVSRQLDFTFDIHGNLTSKVSNVSGDLNVTGYTYGTSGQPHRLTSVSMGGNFNTLSYSTAGDITQYDATTGNDTWLEYDGQHNVTKITVGTSQGTTTARDEFWYTPDGDRFLGRETWDASGVQRTAITTYLGAFEEVRPSAASSYNLFRRVQVTPTVQWMWRSVAAGGTASDWFFQHRDHLGSVDAITNTSGTLVSSVVGKTSFDPFGGRRSKDWSRDITQVEKDALLAPDYEDEKSPRGFTDHEMLNRTGFIHMNGRVYDPRIGRFVSPDPIVQSPTFSQSYNRYAYVFNNPLAYTDPSGFAGWSQAPCAYECPYTGKGNGGQFVFNNGAINPTCDEIAPGPICYESMRGEYGSSIFGINQRKPGDRRRYNSPFPEDESRSDVLPPLVYEGRILVGRKEERRDLYRGPLVVVVGASFPVFVEVGAEAAVAVRAVPELYRDEIFRILLEALVAGATIAEGRPTLEDMRQDARVPIEQSEDLRKSNDFQKIRPPQRPGRF